MTLSSVSDCARPAMTLVAQRSRHRIRPFRLHRPKTADEAIMMRAESVGASAYMSGGIDVVAEMKTGVVLTDIIYLRSLPAWNSIVDRQDGIAIAAGVTHQGLADDRLLRQCYSGLCAGWSTLANNRVRIKGTLAGNLMAANPAYDFALAAIAAGARLEYIDLTRTSGQLPAQRLSEIPEGALLTHIVLPRESCLAFAVQWQWKPIVSFALSFTRVQGATVARLAAGCGFLAAVWAELRLERDLFDRSGRETPADIAEQLCASLPLPVSDWRASSDYRRHLLKVLARREVERIRATGPAS